MFMFMSNVTFLKTDWPALYGYPGATDLIAIYTPILDRFIIEPLQYAICAISACYVEVTEEKQGEMYSRRHHTCC